MLIDGNRRGRVHCARVLVLFWLKLFSSFLYSFSFSRLTPGWAGVQVLVRALSAAVAAELDDPSLVHAAGDGA